MGNGCEEASLEEDDDDVTVEKETGEKRETQTTEENWDLIRLWGGCVELVYLRSADGADGRSPAEIFISHQSTYIYQESFVYGGQPFRLALSLSLYFSVSI